MLDVKRFIDYVIFRYTAGPGVAVSVPLYTNTHDKNYHLRYVYLLTISMLLCLVNKYTNIKLYYK